LRQGKSVIFLISRNKGAHTPWQRAWDWHLPGSSSWALILLGGKRGKDNAEKKYETTRMMICYSGRLIAVNIGPFSFRRETTGYSKDAFQYGDRGHSERQ